MIYNLFSTLASVQKLFWDTFRTFQEQACHNQMGDRKTLLPKLEGFKGSSKTFTCMWQLLDGTYDSIIV